MFRTLFPRFRLMLALPGLMLLSACGASDEGQDVGGLTVGEAKALNEAAMMLDRQADTADRALDVGGNIVQ